MFRFMNVIDNIRGKRIFEIVKGHFASQTKIFKKWKYLIQKVSDLKEYSVIDYTNLLNSKPYPQTCKVFSNVFQNVTHFQKIFQNIPEVCKTLLETVTAIFQWKFAELSSQTKRRPVRLLRKTSLFITFVGFS